MIHQLSLSIGRDDHHAEVDTDTDTCISYRIVRHPVDPHAHYAPQTETILRYEGVQAQMIYELWQDAYQCGDPVPDNNPLDVDDDEQNPEESTVPACEPCEL